MPLRSHQPQQELAVGDLLLVRLADLVVQDLGHLAQSQVAQ
jgi:hypothetical protein